MGDGPLAVLGSGVGAGSPDCSGPGAGAVARGRGQLSVPPCSGFSFSRKEVRSGSAKCAFSQLKRPWPN